MYNASKPPTTRLSHPSSRVRPISQYHTHRFEVGPELTDGYFMAVCLGCGYAKACPPPPDEGGSLDDLDDLDPLWEPTGPGQRKLVHHVDHWTAEEDANDN